MTPNPSTLQRCLITGITGFLGSRIAQMLTQCGVEVIGLKRSTSSYDHLHFTALADKIELHDIDKDGLDLASLLKGRRLDAIFHTAAHTAFIETEAEAITLLDANVRFPCDVLAQAKQSGLVKSLINAGTSWQSTDGRGYSPLNFYAATKEAFEKTLQLAATDGFSCVSLRLFETYGPGDKRNKILDLLLRAALQGDAIDLSPGEQKLCFVHVHDVARAFIIAAELVLQGQIDGYAAYAVMAEAPHMRLRDIADMIEWLVERKISANWSARPYHPHQIMNPGSNLPPVPGWKPEINLEEGLKDMLHYYRLHIQQAA